MGFIRRFFFLIFFCIGGFLFYIPKWLFFGTRAGRERKKLLRQQDEILRGQRAAADERLVAREG